MAGGEGSRLRPLTINVPKPLVPVAGMPIMGHIVRLLKRHGVNEIVTTLHYLAESIQEAFGDGSDWGIAMTHSIEDTPLGTAGSVKQAEVLLKGGTFVIISGDALTDCDLTAAIAYHREKGSQATIVLARVPNPLEFGIVIQTEDGRIDRFLEKPGWGEVFSDTVNTGIYILEPEVLDLVEPGTPTDWSKDVFPKMLAARAPLFGYVMEGYWCDVGTLESYREAQVDLLSGKTTLDVPGEMQAPGVWVGEGTKIDESAEIIGPTYIGAKTVVKRGARVGPGSVVGDDCLVEEDAVIEGSVVWDRSYIGTEVEVSGGIVGSRCTVKRESRIQDGAVVGDRCLLDVGCTVRPRVKVWPDKTIDRGSTLTMSLIVGNRWRGSLFRDLGVAGLSNIEVTPEFATRLAMAFGSVMAEGSVVAVSRDSSRSSRMIKRSVMSALLSSGCEVVDLHGKPVPIARHYISRSRVDAGISVRKQPGNNRLSLLEFFDSKGEYMGLQTERKVESAFFREDFHRADMESLGIIDEALQPVEAYSRDFVNALPQSVQDFRPKIVVDYGYSSVSPLFPSLLGKCGIDAVSLNSYNDARSAPRKQEEVNRHVENLQQMVPSLGYWLGVLVLNEGENIVVVDDQGLPVSGNGLFAAMCWLLARHSPSAKFVMTTSAPVRLEKMVVGLGGNVVRCKSGVRDLMATASREGARFAGNESGGFVFPALQPGFDGMMSIVALVRMLQSHRCSLSEVLTEVPEFHLAQTSVKCPWEAKGKVMRRLSENIPRDRKAEFVDGIKLYDDDSWALVLPDSYEPVIQVMAESDSLVESQGLVNQYRQLIEEYQAG